MKTQALSVERDNLRGELEELNGEIDCLEKAQGVLFEALGPVLLHRDPQECAPDRPSDGSELRLSVRRMRLNVAAMTAQVGLITSKLDI